MASEVGVTHHIKLGTGFYLIRPGTYLKKPAPLFGARFTTGDTSYNNLSFWQHWVQKCWVGGMDSPDWKDDSMYDESVGIDVTNHEQISLARDLTKGTGSYTLNAGSLDCKRTFVVYGNQLYCLMKTTSADSYLYQYTASTDSWALFKTFTGEHAQSATVFGGSLYVGTDSATVINAFDGATWTTVAHPAGRTETVYSMRAFRDRLYVCYGRYIWRLKPDLTWDGATVFFEATGIDEVVATETHLGYLYFLSANGHLVRTDGNNTFDIWSWDGGTTGVSLRSYDGKLFVGTFEYMDTAETGQGVLYQFSGAAVTQLKRWGKIGLATTIGNLSVYDRKLYYGASSLLGMADGFGVAVYDSVEDSHSIFASNRDTVTYADASGVGTDWLVDDVFFYQGFLFVSVRAHGLFRTPVRYRDIQLTQASFDRSGNGADTTPPNGGWITSSDYDANTPGLQKLWRKVVIHCDLPDTGCTVAFEYSIDGGTTYVLGEVLTKDTSAVRYSKEIMLSNVRAQRLKYRVTLRSTTSTLTPTVRGIVVSYLPQPEPNWLWDFTLVISKKSELLDGSYEIVDPETEINYLEGLYRTGDMVTFIDIDGTQWATNGAGVLIYDISRRVSQINPDMEGEVRVLLMEAVETF